MPTVSIWIALQGLVSPKNGRSKWRICRSDLVPALAVQRHIGDHQLSFLTSRLTRCGMCRNIAVQLCSTDCEPPGRIRYSLPPEKFLELSVCTIAKRGDRTRGISN